MTIKNTIVTASFFLAMGTALPGFAETKAEVVDADMVTIECITAADAEALSAEDREKLTLPVCEDMGTSEEGATATQ